MKIGFNIIIFLLLMFLFVGCRSYHGYRGSYEMKKTKQKIIKQESENKLLVYQNSDKLHIVVVKKTYKEYYEIETIYRKIIKKYGVVKKPHYLLENRDTWVGSIFTEFVFRVHRLAVGISSIYNAFGPSWKLEEHEPSFIYDLIYYPPASILSSSFSFQPWEKCYFEYEADFENDIVTKDPQHINLVQPTSAKVTVMENYILFASEYTDVNNGLVLDLKKMFKHRALDGIVKLKIAINGDTLYYPVDTSIIWSPENVCAWKIYADTSMATIDRIKAIEVLINNKIIKKDSQYHEELVNKIPDLFSSEPSIKPFELLYPIVAEKIQCHSLMKRVEYLLDVAKLCKKSEYQYSHKKRIEAYKILNKFKSSKSKWFSIENKKFFQSKYLEIARRNKRN